MTERELKSASQRGTNATHQWHHGSNKARAVPKSSTSNNTSDIPGTYPLVEHCHDFPPQIPTRDTFQQLLDAYGVFPGGGNHQMRQGKLVAPVEIRFGERGRGLFAKEVILEGTQIYESGDDFIFRTERSFVGFLKQLPPPLQCDALLWSFAGKREVILAPDEGGCVNHGGGELKNIAITQDGGFKANRDIAADEELLDDYTAYMRFHRLDWYNNIRKNGWGDAEALEVSADKDNLDLYLKQGAGFASPTLKTDIPTLEDPWTANEPYLLLLGPVAMVGMLLFFIRARSSSNKSNSCKAQ